jgi:hypothetical protein
MSQEEYQRVLSAMGGLRTAAKRAHERKDYEKRNEACRRYDDLALSLIRERNNGT